jgi:glycerophosphoryl diester phosphodiesterase
MNTVKFNKGKTLVVAHRGLSGIERENTSSAFVAAGNRTYYGIETDVHRTADGRFVACHDSSLERIAGEKIIVENASLEILQSVVLLDKDGTKARRDLRLATLEDYVNICKKYEKHCVLELKTAFTSSEIRKIINVFKKLDYLDSVTFISFYYENLKKVRKIIPEQSVQFLFSSLDDKIIKNVIKDKFDVDANARIVTKELVETLHAAGLKVNCWTVDNKETAEALVEMGVDFITTNILE